MTRPCAVFQEAHAVHAEGRGAAHAHQPLPSMHAEDIAEPARSCVTTWCYPSYPLLLLTATSPRNVARVPHCPYENRTVPDRGLPD